MITRMRIEAFGRSMGEVELTLKEAAAMLRETFERLPRGVVPPDMEMVAERDLEVAESWQPNAYKGRALFYFDTADSSEQVSILRERGVAVSTYDTIPTPPPADLTGVTV